MVFLKFVCISLPNYMYIFKILFKTKLYIYYCYLIIIFEQIEKNQMFILRKIKNLKVINECDKYFYSIF